MRRSAIPLVILAGLGSAGCPSSNPVECEDSTSCDLSAGGVCAAAPSGNQWCAYPDPSCPGGLRYSDFHTGDGLGGTCVTPDVDGGVDAPTGTWSAPVPLLLDTPTQPETGGSESPNALELYFEAPQGPATFITDIFYVTRTAPSFAWGESGMAIGAIDTAASETGASISPDGLEMHFTRLGSGIQVSKRGTPGSAWGAPMPTGIDGAAPDVLADGVTMYYVGDSASCPSDLCMVKVTRSDSASPWGNPIVETINEGATYHRADISGDGLRALLTAPAHAGIAPIAIATRANRNASWGGPVPIAELAVYTGITSARWSWDERAIYLTVTGGAYDIQVSQLR